MRCLRTVALSLCLFLMPLALGGKEKEVNHLFDNNKRPENSRTLPAEAGKACGALAYVVKQNGGILPRTKKDWEEALAKFGFDRLDISYSDGLGQSSLEHPRYAYRPNMENDTENRHPDLSNKLFVAVGDGKDGNPVVEFQSWNPINPRGGYDFGSYEGNEEPHLDPIAKCVRCHKNEGPIMTVAGWKSTRSSTVNFVAFIHLLYEMDPETYKAVYDETERLRKHPKAKTMVKASNPFSPKHNWFALEIEKSKIFQKTHYQGVPLIHKNTGLGSGRFFQGRAILANIDLLFYQTFYAIGDKKERSEFMKDNLSRRISIMVNALLNDGSVSLGQDNNKIFPLTERLKKKLTDYVPRGKIRALHGSLVKDRSHVTGKVESNPSVFPFPEGPPTDEEIKANLEYNENRKQAYTEGRNPLDHKFAKFQDDMHIPLDTSHLTLGDLNFSGDIDPTIIREIIKEAAGRVLKKNGQTVTNTAIEEIGMKAVEDALKSPPMLSLYDSPVAPDGYDITNSLIDGLDFYFMGKHQVDSVRKHSRDSMRPALSALECLDLERRKAGLAANRCSRCHKSDEVFKYVSDLDHWADSLKSNDEKVREAAEVWIEKMASRVLDEKDMPPTNSLEGKTFKETRDGQDLIEFLKKNRKK